MPAPDPDLPPDDDYLLWLDGGIDREAEIELDLSEPQPETL